MTCRHRQGQRKPRLTLAEYRLLCEMREYYERHFDKSKRQGLYQVEQIACDVMDGWKWHTDPEVRDLRGKGILKQWRHSDRIERDAHGALLTCPYTWHLTERGARLVAPEAFGGQP